MDRRTFIKGSLALAPLASLAPRTALAALTRPKLIVHEWGTFTSIAGEDGASLEWRPLAGEDDLPSFVYRFDQLPAGLRDNGGPTSFGGKGQIIGTVRMETPVIYFYAEQELDVDVRVDFPLGRITEWYPHARVVAGGAIDWGRVRIMPRTANIALPREAAPSHYYPARETDAAIVRVCGADKNEYERLLFYRGVGTFPLPYSARLEGERVRIPEAGPAIIFENSGGRTGFRWIEDKGLFERPVLDDRPVFESLEKMLIAEGLYAKEARAMIETWRDSWFEEGLRVLWIVPRKTTDELLPLALNPAPTELVRVLVGRTELLTPAFEREVTRLAKDFPTEEQLARVLGPRARFARPVLERLSRGPRLPR